MLKIGQKAPQFTLSDANGEAVSLSDFRGKKVVLYFYSKDMTSGCTTQALGYRDRFNEISKQNAVIVGIRKDSVESHIKFIKKYDLPFVLLSDPDTTVIQEYEVWGEKKLYGKTSYGVVRSTYIIDENGTVIYAKTKVKAADDPENVLTKLRNLEQ